MSNSLLLIVCWQKHTFQKINFHHQNFSSVSIFLPFLPRNTRTNFYLDSFRLRRRSAIFRRRCSSSRTTSIRPKKSSWPLTRGSRRRKRPFKTWVLTNKTNFLFLSIFLHKFLCTLATSSNYWTLWWWSRSGCWWCLDIHLGQGRGRGFGEEDAAARERAGSDPVQPGAGHSQSRGEREGSSECESFRSFLSRNKKSMEWLYKCVISFFVRLSFLSFSFRNHFFVRF